MSMLDIKKYLIFFIALSLFISLLLGVLNALPFFTIIYRSFIVLFFFLFVSYIINLIYENYLSNLFVNSYEEDLNKERQDNKQVSDSDISSVINDLPFDGEIDEKKNKEILEFEPMNFSSIINDKSSDSKESSSNLKQELSENNPQVIADAIKTILSKDK